MFSNYSEIKLLDHIFGKTAWSMPTCWMCLLSSAPTDASTGSNIPELSGGGYGRVQLSPSVWGTPTNGQVTNAQAIDWPTSTASWNTVTHWAITDANAAGNVLLWGAVGTGFTLGTNRIARLQAGAITLGFTDGSAVTNYARNKILGHVLGKSEFAQPSLHVGLTSGTISRTSTGSTTGEPSSGAYARKATASTVYAAAANGQITNSSEIVMAKATASWGTMSTGLVLDALTDGNLLFWWPASIPKAFTTGDTPVLEPSTMTITLD